MKVMTALAGALLISPLLAVGVWFFYSVLLTGTDYIP
jgi:hypothetical protein